MDASLSQSGLFTIKAGHGFAEMLVRGICARAGSAEALATWRIYLPSHRACQTIQAAFLEYMDGQPVMLPSLMPLGEGDELTEEIFDEIVSGHTQILPAEISTTQRQFMLARLIGAMRIGGQNISQKQALILAADLARLMDQMRQADITAEQLDQIIPDRFSTHWQDIVRFLDIIMRLWPELLGRLGRLDPVEKKLKIVEMLTNSWQTSPPAHPVVIAGSTGSLPSTLKMMRAVLGLPAGMVVLPGLANQIDSDDDIDAISTDSGHPQHQLFSLLEQLDMRPSQVADFCAEADTQTGSNMLQRRALWQEVFRPYRQTHLWRRSDKGQTSLSEQAVEGISLMGCRDRYHEADIIAGLMRKTLESKQKTALLVTPDRKLARGVRAALLRWGLDVEDSAGEPLGQSRTGSYLGLVAQWACTGGDAHRLLALAKHKFASGGLEMAAFNRQIRRIETAILRRTLPSAGAEAIATYLDEFDDDGRLADFYRAHILAPLQPLAEVMALPSASLSQLADAHGKSAEMLAQTDQQDEALLTLWGEADGRIAAQLLSEMALYGDDIMLKPFEYADYFQQLAANIPVRKKWRSHPRLAILGTVEARMQSADLVILGGLNEGIWPPAPDTSPWINQEIRGALGLPDRHWRTGLSAHDFFMLAHSPNLVITRSETADEGTATASRWWQRLEAVLLATRLDRRLYSRLPADIQAGFEGLVPDAASPCQMPAPCPALSVRPRTLWATDMDVLISDPYAIYAKYILGLRPLDDVDRPADAALRGTIFHDCLATFLAAYPDGDLPDDAQGRLESIADNYFSAFASNVKITRFWRASFSQIARWFIEQETERRKYITYSLTEVKGKIDIDVDEGAVSIGAKADRLDFTADNLCHVIDYKTGTPPTKAQVTKGRATQLMIEAFIARAGAFDGQNDTGSVEIDRLEYWQLSGKEQLAGQIKDVTPTAFDPDSYFEDLTSLIRWFDDPAASYPSEPDSQNRPRFSNYRHLARVREWRRHEVGDDDK